MNFMDAVKICLNKYVDFTGRARRSEFWFFVLFNLCAQIAASIVDAIIASVIGFSALAMLVSLALLLPGLAVSIRRLHDTDRSGWWILIGLIPIIGIIMLIIWYVSPGTPGPNRFGADPKGGFAPGPVPAAGYVPPAAPSTPTPPAAGAAPKGTRPWER